MSLCQSQIRTLGNALLLTTAMAVAAVGVVVGSAPAFGRTGAEIVTDVAPPPDRVEHAPPPRDGYVWGAGHWEWNGRVYVWISGTWIPERRAAHWVVDRWEPVGARWHYVAGHWER